MALKGKISILYCNLYATVDSLLLLLIRNDTHYNFLLDMQMFSSGARLGIIMVSRNGIRAALGIFNRN